MKMTERRLQNLAARVGLNCEASEASDVASIGMSHAEFLAETVASSGYVASRFRDSSHRNGETCEDINECDEWNYAAACYPCTCNNWIIRFSCACPTGFRSVAGEGNDMCDREVCGTAQPIQHLSCNDTSVNWYVALRNVRKALVRNSEVGKTLLCVPVFVFLGSSPCVRVAERSSQ